MVNTQGVKRGMQELRALGLNIESRVNESNTNEEEEEDQVRQVDAHNDDQVQPDRVAKAIEAHVLIDRLHEDVGELAPEMAFKAMEMDPEKIEPSKYKDIFENPKKFDEAWNHHDEFQRKKWREAIMKEFDKMELNKVWTKVKRKQIPEGRRSRKGEDV